MWKYVIIHLNIQLCMSSIPFIFSSSVSYTYIDKWKLGLMLFLHTIIMIISEHRRWYLIPLKLGHILAFAQIPQWLEVLVANETTVVCWNFQSSIWFNHITSFFLVRQQWNHIASTPEYLGKNPIKMIWKHIYMCVWTIYIYIVQSNKRCLQDKSIYCYKLYKNH